MSEKHTPGPWTAEYGGTDALVRCDDGRSFLIGDVVYHEENKANARLIAAAPELLDLLKGWRDRLNDGRDLPGWACEMLEEIEFTILRAEAK